MVTAYAVGCPGIDIAAQKGSFTYFGLHGISAYVAVPLPQSSSFSCRQITLWRKSASICVLASLVVVVKELLFVLGSSLFSYLLVWQARKFGVSHYKIQELYLIFLSARDVDTNIAKEPYNISFNKVEPTKWFERWVEVSPVLYLESLELEYFYIVHL